VQDKTFLAVGSKAILYSKYQQNR